MAKGHFDVSLDVNVWEVAQRLFPHQLSSLINDYLTNLINSSKRDISAINIELEKLELEKESKKMTQLQANIKKRQMAIEEWEKVQSEKKETELTKQKQEIEKQHTCCKCHQVVLKKIIKIGENIYCEGCYLRL